MSIFTSMVKKFLIVLMSISLSNTAMAFSEDVEGMGKGKVTRKKYSVPKPSLDPLKNPAIKGSSMLPDPALMKAPFKTFKAARGYTGSFLLAAWATTEILIVAGGLGIIVGAVGTRIYNNVTKPSVSTGNSGDKKKPE